MVDILEAKIWEEILYVKFKRLIGLKSEKVSGEEIFGIREMKKAFVSLNRQPEEKKWVTASITSLLTIFQLLVKKIPENPSGPSDSSN